MCMCAMMRRFDCDVLLTERKAVGVFRWPRDDFFHIGGKDVSSHQYLGYALLRLVLKDDTDPISLIFDARHPPLQIAQK